MAPSVGVSNSFSTSRTSLAIGRLKIWPGTHFLSTTQNVALHTSFLDQHQYQLLLLLATESNDNHLSVKQYHQLQGFVSSFFIYALLAEIPLSICFKIIQQYAVHIAIFFEYTSGLLNSSCGGMTTFIFIVRRLLGENGLSLFESLMVSTVNSLKLMIRSAINVLTDSTFKEWFWIFSNPSKIILADQIWHSHTPPTWEVQGGLLYHRIQSAPFSCKKFLILLCFISLNPCCDSFLAPTKFVPLSNQIKGTVPLLAINLSSAKIKESSSKELVTSMWIAWLEK